MIVIAPDSFKGTLSAVEVCKIICDEFLKKSPNADIRCIPVADGGEGTVDALLFNGGGRVSLCVKDPYFNDIESFYGIMPDGTAVIEMAAASGLPLVGDNKNPMKTTTYGTGQLISDALVKGCKKILIGIGGSATNDGGIGCAAALGVKFLDSAGNEVPLCGEGLEQICDIDMSGVDVRLKSCEIIVLCDVISPLFGKYGAAYVFAPQKGADAQMVEDLDKGLRNLAFITKEVEGTDNSQLAGAGAAGGLGFGLVTFLGAKLVGGAGAVLEAVHFGELARKAELVITGEGCMDAQSLLGKAPAQVAARSGKTPVIAVVGMSKIESAANIGIEKIYVSNYRGRAYNEMVAHCREDLAEASDRAAGDWLEK